MGTEGPSSIPSPPRSRSGFTIWAWMSSSRGVPRSRGRPSQGNRGRPGVALEARGLDAVSINVRITAVRKLAVEAADNGLLGPELANAETAGVTGIAPHDCRRICAKLCRAGSDPEPFQPSGGFPSPAVPWKIWRSVQRFPAKKHRGLSNGQISTASGWRVIVASLSSPRCNRHRKALRQHGATSWRGHPAFESLGLW
jgi:hypothetical protein